MWEYRGCPWCHGDLYQSYPEEGKVCLQCGRSPDKPSSEYISDISNKRHTPRLPSYVQVSTKGD